MKTFYVASYGKGDDKGIYIVSYNEETLELKKIQPVSYTHLALPTT